MQRSPVNCGVTFGTYTEFGTKHIPMKIGKKLRSEQVWCILQFRKPVAVKPQYVLLYASDL